jgi:large subunit ribosomal protein L23
MFMRLIGTDLTKSPALATLQVSPRMTKTEVREYLTKIYDVNVLKVDTMNMAGGWKRLYGKRVTKAYRRRNYKLAYVSYNPEGSVSSSATAK